MNTCVCCGAVIPEGQMVIPEVRMVCPICERGVPEF